MVKEIKGALLFFGLSFGVYAVIKVVGGGPVFSGDTIAALVFFTIYWFVKALTDQP